MNITLHVEGQVLTGAAYENYMRSYDAFYAARGATLPFVVGESYPRHDGVMVKCIERSPSGECVRFDDGDITIIEGKPYTLGWRYDRDSDRGRRTAGRFDNYHNVIPRSAA